MYQRNSDNRTRLSSGFGIPTRGLYFLPLPSSLLSFALFLHFAFFPSFLNSPFQNFREPIKAKKLLNDKEFVDMFSNIMVLLNLNKQLFKDIQAQLITNPSSPEIAPIFLSFSDFLKMYSSYCMNQPKALGTLSSIGRQMTHPEFREFLVQKYNTLETGIFTLRSYLIKPVQRVCKYPLFLRVSNHPCGYVFPSFLSLPLISTQLPLLKELMKHTATDHTDFPKLEKAMKRIQEAVESIEQNTKSLENIEKIAEIQNRIEGGEKLGLVEPTRRFVREGQLKEIQIRGKEVVLAEDAYYYLFNDILVR
jgi:FYVE/RhoGEF/PH domain-containing protein 5/6